MRSGCSRAVVVEVERKEEEVCLVGDFGCCWVQVSFAARLRGKGKAIWAGLRVAQRSAALGKGKGKGKYGTVRGF